MLIAKNTLRNIIVVWLGLTTAGCGGSGISDSGEPQDRGTLLLANAQTGFGPRELIWTRDGTEVVFVDGALKAVNVSSRSVRVLDPTAVILSVARGSSGEWIYFAGAVPNAGPGTPNVRISRVHPARAGVETIALVFQGASTRLVVSADERWIALGRILLDSQSGLSRELPSGAPYDFSPDGTQLLYEFFAPNSFALISTADGSSQPVLSEGFVSAFRWTGNSPQILVVQLSSAPNSGTTTRIFELDGLTGVTRDFGQFNAYASLFNANWSEDGQTLGVWLEPNPIRTELAVFRAGGAPVIALRVDANVGKPVFSPAGAAVVYPLVTSSSLFSSVASLYVKTGI